MTNGTGKVDLASYEPAAAQRLAFEDLFPGVLADGVLDATRLGELLDVPVTAPGNGRERFGLMWAGKREAVQSLLTQSRGALVPEFDQSVDFDTAHNVFIEGDNLEVLKLLQKAYNDKVKLIYIDPPYNTGNDFLYNDDFRDGLRAYLSYTGQLNDEGKRLSSSADLAGRLHSRWLCMIYPRLVLARNVLAQDGLIAVSIDHNEVSNLKLTLDEVFGPENYLNTFVWVSNLKGRQISDGGAVGTHEYILCYARNASAVRQFRGSQSNLSALMPAVYRGAGYEVKHDARGPYVTKNELYNTNSKFNEVTAPTMVFRIHYNPGSGEVRVSDVHDDRAFPGFLTVMPHTNARPDVRWHAWRWSRSKVLADRDDLEFDVSNGRLRIRTKIRDIDGMAVKDLILGPSTATAQADLDALGLGRLFDTPKPVSMLQVLVSATTGADDLVLDFFAGSGSTAHAVARQNARDGGRRRCISVNLPEPVPHGSEAAKAGLRTVSDITRLRLRKVMEVEPSAADLGLRSLRLSGSSFREATTSSTNMLDLGESTLADGDPVMEAIAAEVLLKEGVPLDAPWSRGKAGGAEVVTAGGVAVVLSSEITGDIAAEALELKPRVVVFLEDGFAGRDAAKANVFTNAKNHGITMKTV